MLPQINPKTDPKKSARLFPFARFFQPQKFLARLGIFGKFLTIAKYGGIIMAVSTDVYNVEKVDSQEIVMKKDSKSFPAVSLCLLVFFAASTAAFAVNYYWDVASGDWSVGTNWDPAGPPTSADTTYIDNGGTAQISSDTDATTLYVGYDNSGAISQSGGIASLDYMHLGYNVGSSGTYDLNSGELVMYQPTIYDRASIGYEGTGVFNQYGGTHTTTGLSIGTLSGSSGTYNLYDGTLYLEGGQAYNPAGLIVGDQADSSGVLNIYGGTLNYHESQPFKIGNESGSSGVLNLEGGTINITLSCDMYIGGAEGSTGIVNHNDGTITAEVLDFDLYVGKGGAYNHNGGLIEDTSIIVGGGAFYQNGTYIDAYDLLVNNGGTYTINTGSHLSIWQSHDFIITSGTFNHNGGLVESNSLKIQGPYSTTQDPGTYNFTDGTLDIGILYIGYDTGTAERSEFNQSGGTATIGSIYVGNADGYDDAKGKGVYNMEGGELTVASDMTIGKYPYSGCAGIFSISDGADITIGENLIFDEGGYITDNLTANTIDVSGGIYNESLYNIDFDLRHSTLTLHGGTGEWLAAPPDTSHPRDITNVDMNSLDNGAIFKGLDYNFAIGNIVFAGTETGSTWYQLLSDIYCYGIVVEEGAAIDLNGFNIYYVPLGAAPYSGISSTGAQLDGAWFNLEGNGDIIPITAMPEPGTVALLAIGALGLAGVIRRRK